MTNPLAIIALHAADAYYTAATKVANQPTTLLPKSLLYALGTTILATVLYKSINRYANPTATRPSNFFYVISLPLKYLYYKLNFRKSIKDKVVLFEDKYFEEYNEWLANNHNNINHNHNNNGPTTTNVIVNPVEEAHKKERLENMYYLTVKERINDFYGDVMMCYDHATLSFAYYARTANIPYKYLETISRKYMIETNAPREIHVDIREEYKKAKDKTKTHHTTTNTSTNTSTTTTTKPSQGGGTLGGTLVGTPDDSPFVKLKSYNTVSNLNLHTTTNDTKEKTHKFATPDKTTNQEASSSIIRENANRYSYRGKLSDFEEHHHTFLADRRKAAAAAATAADTADSSSATAAATAANTANYAEFKKQMLQRSAL
jgi:hypothetical protein